MLKSKILMIFTIILTIGAISFLGCGSDDSTPPPSSAQKIDNSIISLPESLTSDESTASRSFKAVKSGSGDDEGMEGIYSGIRHYIAMAEMFKDIVKDLMVNIAENGLLDSAVEGQEYDISDDSHPEAPQRLLLEKDSSGVYVWKLSLFFTETGADPELIVRFTLTDSAAKGRILWEMTDVDDELADAGITEELEITRKVDVTFDGTSSTKTLEIKVIQDLSNYVAYANDNWGSLTDDEKEALDIGQPEKVFCNASYDGTEFTIYGTSYHPGWKEEADLNGETTFWGDARSMYMFKTKAIEGSTEGAKLYLALPEQDASDITNVWTEDSVGNIFTTMMLNQLNAYIAQLHAAANPVADALVEWITGVAPAGDADYEITKEELEAFVNDPPSDEDAQQFVNMYKSISYMINPAFYDATSGFLGTYDETNDIFYNYTGTGMEAGTPPASFTVLNVLDLSTINPYVPTEVVSAEITVE